MIEVHGVHAAPVQSLGLPVENVPAAHGVGGAAPPVQLKPDGHTESSKFEALPTAY